MTYLARLRFISGGKSRDLLAGGWVGSIGHLMVDERATFTRKPCQKHDGFTTSKVQSVFREDDGLYIRTQNTWYIFDVLEDIDGSRD